VTLATSAQTAPRMLRGATAFFAARGTGVLLGLAVTLLLTRSLSRFDFGTLSIGLTVVALGTTLSDAGLNGVLIREGVRTPDDEADLLRWALRIRWLSGLVASILVAGLSLLIATTASARLTIAIFGLALPLLAPSIVYTALQRRYLIGRVALLMLLQNAQWFVVVVVLAAVDAPLPVYAGGFVAVSALNALQVAAFGKRVMEAPRGMLSRGEVMHRLRQAVPLGLTAVLALLYAKIDGLLLFGMKGATASAGYAASYRLLDVGSLVPASLASVFSTMFVYALRDRKTAHLVGARWVRLSLLLSAPVVVCGEILAGPLVRLVFGAQYSDSVFLLRLLLPTFALVCLEWVWTSMSTSAGIARRQLQVAVSALVVNVVLNVALIPSYGARACAAVTLATECVVVGLGWFIVHRAIPGRLWPSIGEYGRLAAVLAIAAAPAAFLPAWAAAATFAVLYIAGILLTRLATSHDWAAGASGPATPTEEPPTA
jgi:O-antigen/teichoic acid export membrane protein